MDRSASTFLAVCVALVAFAIVYWLNPPAPEYDPLSHTWAMQIDNGRPGISWYGRSLWGFGAAIVGGFATTTLWRLRRQSEAERSMLKPLTVKVMTIVALAALGVFIAAIIVREFNRWGVW